MSIESAPTARPMTDHESAERVAADRLREAADDAAEIRYGLTALGEALVADRARVRFRGFGPCPVARIAG